MEKKKKHLIAVDSNTMVKNEMKKKKTMLEPETAVRFAWSTMQS